MLRWGENSAWLSMIAGYPAWGARGGPSRWLGIGVRVTGDAGVCLCLYYYIIIIIIIGVRRYYYSTMLHCRRSWCIATIL